MLATNAENDSRSVSVAPGERADSKAMQVWSETGWFAVQTKPHREMLAAAHMARLEVEAFLPRVRQEQTICGAIRQVTKPLFSCYFFARYCPTVLIDSVRYSPGVLRVVGSSKFPLPVEDGLVAAIKDSVLEDRRLYKA